MYKKNKLIFYCFLLFLFISCTFDYKTYSSSLDLDKNSPSIQIINLVYYDIVDNKNQTILKSKSFYHFNKEKIYKVDNGNFFLKINNIIGKFDKLKGSQVTKDLDIKGNIEIKMEDKNNFYLLNTNRLFWKNNEKNLYAPQKELVFIRFNGNKLRGKNFSYFFETNTYYFYSGIEGFFK